MLLYDFFRRNSVQVQQSGAVIGALYDIVGCSTETAYSFSCGNQQRYKLRQIIFFLIVIIRQPISNCQHILNAKPICSGIYFFNQFFLISCIFFLHNANNAVIGAQHPSISFRLIQLGCNNRRGIFLSNMLLIRFPDGHFIDKRSITAQH